MAGPIDRIVDDLLKQTTESNFYLESISRSIQQRQAEQTPTYLTAITINLTDSTRCFQLISSSNTRKKFRIKNTGADECLILNHTSNTEEPLADYTAPPSNVRMLWYPLDKGEYIDIETKSPLYGITNGTSLISILEVSYDTFMG